MARLGSPIKSTRPLRENYKRLTLLFKGGSFEYKFEPPLWTGRDIRDIQRFSCPKYRDNCPTLWANKTFETDTICPNVYLDNNI